MAPNKKTYCKGGSTKRQRFVLIPFHYPPYLLAGNGPYCKGGSTKWQRFVHSSYAILFTCGRDVFLQIPSFGVVTG